MRRCICRVAALGYVALGAMTVASGSRNAPTDLVVLPDRFAKTRQTTGLQPAPEPSVVDLGIFYGQELLQRGRTLTGLDETVLAMTDFMNAALVSSGVPLTVRVTYAGVFEERLAGIDTRTAHQLLGQHGQAVRETTLTDFGVDAIVLIKATEDVDEFFGVATLGTEGSLSDPATVPHAVVCLGAAPTSGLECFGRGGIFSHEAGHLFGAGHQRNAPVGGSGGAFVFSYASECGGGTIVYSPVSAAQRIYSTPDVMANGEPCGISASAGADGIDNAHTIDLTRALMADLRATMPVDGMVFVDGDTTFAVTEGDAPLTLQLRRHGNLAGPARVSLAVVSSQASAADINIDPQEAVFQPGQELVPVEIAIVDDAVFEPVEIIDIGLRNPWRLGKTSDTVRLTITDNDPPPPPSPVPPSPPVPPPAPRSSGGSLGLPFVLLLSCVTVLRLRRRRRGVAMQPVL